MDGKERARDAMGEKGWSAKKGRTGEERRRRETAHGTAQDRKRELRSEWKQTKGGGNVGLQDEREGEAAAAASSPVPPLPPPVRMPLSRVCVFSYSLDVRRFHSPTKTGRGRTWHGAA